MGVAICTLATYMYSRDVYAVALGKQLNFLIHSRDIALYIMTHDLLSSGATYLCADDIVDDVIITVFLSFDAGVEM